MFPGWKLYGGIEFTNTNEGKPYTLVASTRRPKAKIRRRRRTFSLLEKALAYNIEAGKRHT